MHPQDDIEPYSAEKLRSTQPQEGKKPYSSPQLITYGDIRDITQAGLFGTGAYDGTTIIVQFKTTGGIRL